MRSSNFLIRIGALLTALALATPASAMTTPILTLNPTTTNLSTSADRYIGCESMGRNGGLAGSDTVEQPIPTAGTISKLTAYFPVALTGAQQYVVTVLKNDVSTALTVTIDSTHATSTDSTHSVSFAAGDACSVLIHPVNTPAAQTSLEQIGMVFDGTTDGESIILATGISPTVGLNQYLAPGSLNGFGVPENQESAVMPTAGTIDNLYVNLSGTPGGTASYVISIFQNEATSTLTCKVTSAATTCSDTNGAHALTFAKGDRISVATSYPDGNPTSRSVNVGIRFKPTTNGESVMLGTGLGPSASLNVYQNTGGQAQNAQTESQLYAVAPIAFTWKKEYVTFQVAPGVGTSRDVAARVGGVTQALTLTIQDTNTSNEDAVHTVSVNANDLINWITVPHTTPTSPTYMRISAVMYIAPAGGGGTAGEEYTLIIN